MEFDHELNQARSAAIRNNHKKARAILRQVIERQPRNVEAWLLFAEVAQNTEDALRCVDRVLKIDPENEAAARKRAYLLPPSAREIKSRLQVDAGSYDFKQRLGFEGEEDGEYGGEANEEAGAYLMDDFQQNAADFDPFDEQGDETDLAGDDKQVTKKQVWDYSQYLEPAMDSGAWKEEKKSGSRLESVLLAGVISFSVLCVISLACIFLLPKAALSSGGGSEEVTRPEDECIAVVYENLEASNAEDIDAYMATIHSHSPLYDQTEDTLYAIFRSYDLSYQIDRLDVVKSNPTEIQLSFELTTKKIRGPGFRDNTIDGVMILRQEGGLWKIYDQMIDNVNYLN